MSLHGSASSQLIWHRLGRDDEARTTSMRASASAPSGFRHFLGDPALADRFTIDGVPYEPANGDQRVRGQQLMRRLALRLEREPPPPSGFDNPNIPSGYTYFFQLVAHDLVHSTAFLSLSEGQLATIANTRGTPLRLETVYAEGPAARPDLYERKTAGSRFHPTLRVGPLREDGLLGGGAKPTLLAQNLDIARAVCPFANSLRASGLPEAIIGDVRNDDHPVLSQMVVLFHHLHNTILDSIAENRSHPEAGSAFDADHLNFLCARTAATLIYRSIIRHDLLVRLLHPEIRAAYERDPKLIRDPSVASGESWHAPFELTHSVFRAAHAMIRTSYKFNRRTPPEEFTLERMLLQSSDDQPTEMPLQRKWAIDWSFFFGARPDNLSRRIRPHFDQHLSSPVVFPAENGDNVPGLAYRDLLSGIDAGPWSVAGLVRSLWPTHGQLLGLSPLFPAPPPVGAAGGWQTRVATWLDAVQPLRPADEFSDEDIASLSKDPPLGVFVAIEALVDPAAREGERFGVLGSIVMADVFYDILRNDPLVPGAMALTLPQQMQALSRRAFPSAPNLLSFIPDITTVDGLLDFMKPRMPQLP